MNNENMIKDIRIYTKSDIITIQNIYTFNLYCKAKMVEVRAKNNYIKTYNLEEITQIDISTKLDGENVKMVDTIIF